MRLLARLGWFVILSGVVVALFAVSFYVSMRMVFVGREVTVPDLAGMSVDDARATLNLSELFLEPTAERYDERVPMGHVQAQDPVAGATIKKNRKVRVTISLGPLAVNIPDLRGQTLRSARIALQKEGLLVGYVTATHEDDVMSDVVMAQHPLPPDPQTSGTDEEPFTEPVGVTGGRPTMDLLVSRGRLEPIYVMPDLAHRRLSEVTAFAKRAGLRIGAVRREKSDENRSGTVIKQYPEAGYPIGRQEIISLVVSD